MQRRKRNHRSSLTAVIAKLYSAVVVFVTSEGLTCTAFPTTKLELRLPPYFVSMSLNERGDDSVRNNSDLYSDLQARSHQIEVDQWRRRLDDENLKSMLKRKPIKLPYEDARRWVQANLGPDTKEDFDDLVANGNLRTPYIPKRPEEYYTETREWISWDHFLHGIFDGRNPSNIRPWTGSFD